MAAYYNEIDPYAAGWLRNLIGAGLIAAGEVDTRDIRDVCPADLAGFTQCHFFAGIGLWSRALRDAGWPDASPVWTGSCPCQPFSAAGRGGGFADKRHLWPAWYRLISELRPGVVFGEQVASPDGIVWLDLVSADMESSGYAIGPIVFPSSGLGAPNIRHRLWWVADADRERWTGQRLFDQQGPPYPETARRGEAGRVANPDSEGQGRRCDNRPGEGPRAGTGRAFERSAGLRSTGGRLDDTSHAGLPDAEPYGLEGSRRRHERRATEQPSGAFAPWRELQWIACTDGRARPTQPGLFPLAHRSPGDVAKLRAYGNAINPIVAAEVIHAYLTAERSGLRVAFWRNLAARKRLAAALAW